MSVQSLNRWGGAFILVVAAITLVGGLIRFAALEMNAGNLVLGQVLYTGAYLVGGFVFVALVAPRATRMGKRGVAGFIFSSFGLRGTFFFGTKRIALRRQPNSIGAAAFFHCTTISLWYRRIVGRQSLAGTGGSRKVE